MKKRTNEQQLEYFSKSRWSFVVFQGSNVLYRSVGKGVDPPVKYIQKYPYTKKKVTIYDRYIGRAAALLFLIIKPRSVLTTVVTTRALNLLRRHGISCYYLQKSKYLMGAASAKMCRWEKLAHGQQPRDFFDLVKKQSVR